MNRFRETPRTSQLWSVWWREKDRWTIYQSGLSRRRADDLARSVTYYLAPRWGLPNVPTKVLPDGAEPPGNAWLGEPPYDRDMLREIIDDELYEWGEYALSQMPGYLEPIARDAGVDLRELTRLYSHLMHLDRRGQGGGVTADRIAHQIGQLVDELRDQVKNAGTGQLDEYIQARDAWLES